MRWMVPPIMAVMAAAGLSGAPAKGPTADAVLAELKAGNARHVSKHYLHPNQTAARQRELVTGQAPHAAVLSCADSRVAPEIVFDRGLGDIFTVRVAGNVADPAETASLEYAAEHFHCPVIVVMGHQKCGAVSAAIQGGDAPGQLPLLLKELKPAVDGSASLQGDHLENAVRVNVENVVRQLKEAKPVLSGLTASGQLKIVGAVYALDTGKVAWLPDQKISPK